MLYDEYVSRIKQGIAYIEDHLKEDISLDQVARQSAFSTYYFHRLFQSIVGINVADYVRKRRLTAAAYELISTERRILDIALDYRFLTQESFTRAFKKMFYMTPGRYRTYSLQVMDHSGGEVRMENTLLPEGWMISGSHPSEYETGIDYQNVHQGRASGYIKAGRKEADGFVTMMQMFRADKYKGKRLRLSGFIKTESTAYAGLWMRIDGKYDDILAFDNMSNRPIKGTTNWNQYSVVLDVSQDSVAIAFGFLLSGTGIMWVDSLRFDVVDEKVPTTNIEDIDEMPDEPINLNFEGQTL
ncbi:helix-turn-helix domain-containing protein [Aneurinibacillus uraniidurans]|uniref:helix-turn-helix domain-containing protein n=1 Tax=Aneurinibacillus uraniidurans TaxID=2966586 RepID=UPI00234A664A|nr:AraC family transcriptional regulator [Aneurinibacillus sp. B1]WCN37719.1 AraC family transcriptional regulator [Aneurinibacillus sp. B1]